jgi:hypothetical protein
MATFLPRATIWGLRFFHVAFEFLSLSHSNRWDLNTVQSVVDFVCILKNKALYLLFIRTLHSIPGRCSIGTCNVYIILCAQVIQKKNEIQLPPPGFIPYIHSPFFWFVGVYWVYAHHVRFASEHNILYYVVSMCG